MQVTDSGTYGALAVYADYGSSALVTVNTNVVSKSGGRGRTVVTNQSSSCCAALAVALCSCRPYFNLDLELLINGHNQ